MVNDEYASSATDLVGRFRFNETSEIKSAQEKTLDFLALNVKDPLSKPELVEHLNKRAAEQDETL